MPHRTANGQRYCEDDRDRDEADGVDRDDRRAFDADSVCEPHHVATEIDGEQERGHVAGSASHEKLARLEQRRQRRHHAVGRCDESKHGYTVFHSVGTRGTANPLW